MSQSLLARKLIELIENRGLLDQEITNALRQQLDESGARVTPEALVKLLVDNGHLTRFQATKLISEVRSKEYVDDEAADDEAVAVQEVVEEPELTLDEGNELSDDVAEVEPVEVEAVEVEAVEVDPVEVEAVEVEAVAVEATPVEAVAAPMDGGRSGNGVRSGKRSTSRRNKDDDKNKWDSFKIYGVAGLILTCLPLGWFFYNYITKVSAAEYMENANSQYSSENYSGALQTYQDFVDNYDDDTDDASMARVRIVMCQLYQILQASRDPAKFLTLANELLPTVADEVAMNDNRDDLAGLLIEVAKTFVQRADNTRIADEKQTLIEQLDQLMQLINRAEYVSSDTRKAMSKPLDRIREDQARVVRDISRDRKLADTIAAMETAIDAEDTKTAYDARKAIIDDYPRLQDEQRMDALILKAGEMQRDLVKTGIKDLDVSTDEIPTKIKNAIVLANQSGREIPSLEGMLYYVRVGGSVVALQASNGSLKWRRFVGYQDEHPPTALGNGSGDGVLLSNGENLEVQRLSGADGKLEWRVSVGETFSQPRVAGDSIYLSTYSGKVVSLDIETGDTRWISQLAQPLEVSPGVEHRRGVAYVTGNHSNLYVMNHRDGSCSQSYYIGHEEKSVSTSPVYLLGHVFVFENPASDYCLMHILETDEQGLNLKKAQNTIRLEGNVLVDPLVDGRRIVVVTNLGQVSAFEVEPTAEVNKISEVAQQVPSYAEPTLTQMEIDKSQMWVVGSNILRYELQINTGRIIPGKVQNDGDTFTARPQLMEGDALIHARAVRGSRGIRVAAVEPKTMELIWKTDLGVPTVMVAQSTAGLHAVTSQGALYEIDRESIASGATKSPVENPGGSGHGIEFVSPIAVDETVRIFVNRTKPSQIAIYDPSRERQKLRLVTLALPDGNLSGEAVVSPAGLLVPLDSGRVALMDWQSGRMITNPFQPSLKPGETVRWTAARLLPEDAEQVIIGDSRKRMYRVRVGERIRQLAMEDLQLDWLGPLAVVNDTVFAIAKGPSSDRLVTLDSNSLKKKDEVLIEARVIWGPRTIGNVTVLATDKKKLVAYSPAGKKAWEADLPEGEPVGDPLLVGSTMTIAGRPGWLASVDAATGESIGLTMVGQPLAGSPVPVGQLIVVPGSEGIVFAVDPPSQD